MIPEIKVDITFNKFPQLIREAPEKASQIVSAIAQHGKNYVVLSFGTSPAPAGMPPGVDTDTLRGGIHIQPMGRFEREIRDASEYGVYLEFGSTRHSYTWPFMTPMADWLRPQIPDFFDRFLP